MVRGFHDNDTSLAIQPPRVPELTPRAFWAYQKRAEGSQETEIGHWLSLRKSNWKPRSPRGGELVEERSRLGLGVRGGHGGPGSLVLGGKCSGRGQ